MSKIRRFLVQEDQSIQGLIDWVGDAKHRFYDFFEEKQQLELAKKIAAVEDSEARQLLLSLLDTASSLGNTVKKAKSEFATVHKALIKIDADIDADEERASRPANP